MTVAPQEPLDEPRHCSSELYVDEPIERMRMLGTPRRVTQELPADQR